MPKRKLVKTYTIYVNGRPYKTCKTLDDVLDQAMLLGKLFEDYPKLTCEEKREYITER